MSLRLRLRIPLVLLAGLAVTFQVATPTAGASTNRGHRVPGAFAGVNYSGDGLPTARVKTIRLWDDGTNWCNLEPSEGSWNTKPLSDAVKAVRTHHPHAQIILVLGMTPMWASTGPSTATVGRGDICPDQTRYTTTAPKESAWRGFVTHIAKQFKGRIAAYEVWNEPSSTDYWSGDVATMSRLTTVAHHAVRSVDPAAQVLSASLTRSTPGWSKPYLQQIANDGWHVDGIAFHSYSHDYTKPDPADPTKTTPDLAAMLRDHKHQVNQVKQDIKQLQPPRPISLWETELNHNFAKGSPSADALSAEAQVELVGRTFMNDLDLGVNREVWYSFDRANGGVRMNDTGPAYRALRTMQSWVGGHVFHGCKHTTQSNVAVTRCSIGGREIDWAASSVKVPGLDGERCILPDGGCRHATDVTLSPTPQRIDQRGTDK